MLTFLATLLVIDSARASKLTAAERQQQSQDGTALLATLALLALVWPMAVARGFEHAGKSRAAARALAYTAGILTAIILTPIGYLAIGCAIALVAAAAASAQSSR